MSEAMLPQNLDAELALIGSILIDPEAFVLVSDFLTKDDFYRESHKRVFEVMEYLVAHEDVPDMISVCDELERRQIKLDANKLNESYLAATINLVPTSGNAEMYGHMIEDRAVCRRLINAAGLIAASAQGEKAEIALANAEQAIFDIAERRNVSTYRSIADIMVRCMQTIEEASTNKSPLIGISTGFHDLDRLLKGWRKKALYILAARPGQGKTSFALSVAYTASRKGLKVAIFSLEMGEEELGFRLVSILSNVPSDRIQAGLIEDNEWGRVEHAMSAVTESHMVIDETSGLSIAQVRSRCRQIKAKQGLDFVIVDYLQLLSAVKRDGKTHENRVQEISEISRGLKSLAKSLNVPVLALSQLSRAVESRQSKVPILSDLRESGSIEADADSVLFIYRDETYNPNSDRKGQADIIIAKNRHGSCGEVTLAFKADATRFANLETVINQDGSPVEDED